MGEIVFILVIARNYLPPLIRSTIHGKGTSHCGERTVSFVHFLCIVGGMVPELVIAGKANVAETLQ